MLKQPPPQRRRQRLRLINGLLLSPEYINLICSPATPQTPLPPPPPPPPPPPAVDPEMEESVSTVQHLIGYSFTDPSLLEEALTHSSYPQRQSFQRLEFVGDAALTLAFSNYLYLTNPGLGPGPLSALRAANISTEKLARVAVRLGLYNYLRINSPFLDQKVEEFIIQVNKEQNDHLLEVPYGGTAIKAPKVLADIVEGVTAAIYVDCGFNLEQLWKVFRKHLEPIITADTMDEQPVTTLYELCQRHRLKLEFETCEKGDLTITDVIVGGDIVGTGWSKQKVIAKLNATRDALQKLPHLLPDTPNRVPRENDGSKQKLNEFCTKNHWTTPVYRIEREKGPAHDKRFVCSVVVETCSNIFISVGEEKAKVKDAENSAAAKMLLELSPKNQR